MEGLGNVWVRHIICLPRALGYFHRVTLTSSLGAGSREEVWLWDSRAAGRTIGN